MSTGLPMVTVVIPTRPEQEEIPAVAAVQQVDYPRERLEILVARGRQPSVQRNAALRAAKGDLVYFLDDDARPLPGNLLRAAKSFEDPKVEMLGGPNLCPADAPALEQVFAVVLGSGLAFGPSRARYARVGERRSTTEKELILCNLLARRRTLLELGGFDESLYPNEENALMDALVQRGAVLLYDPELLVYRRPRPTLGSFCKMLMTYGRGRAEQFRLHPTFGSALNFVPPLFCVYLLLLPLLGWGIGWIGLGPLGLYLLALLAQAAGSARTHGWKRSVESLPFVVLTHVLYGCGFWRGLFTRLGSARRAVAAEISVQHISLT